MKIIILPEVRDYLNDLAVILYDNFYFGFEESAIKYVRDLFHEIETTLPNKQKKNAPPYFSKYGKNMHYSVFRKNQNTQWYVFFNYSDDIYLIRYIGNNYNCAQYIKQ